MSTLTYRVDTDHPSRVELCFFSEPIEVTACHDYCWEADRVVITGYCAEHELLGMGKQYRTPGEAVLGLLRAHSCTLLSVGIAAPATEEC